MWSFGKVPWLCLALLCAACPDAHLCKSSEQCNSKDDDCDGKVDEDFVDSSGRYVGKNHCGRCDVSCDAVFESASSTVCDTTDTVPVCRINACKPGFHQAGEGGCVPDEVVLCLPCTSDAECSAGTPGARCLDVEGERRCGVGCDTNTPCPSPFECDLVQGQCFPAPKLCACDDVDETFEVACIGQGVASDVVCAGLQTCTPQGLSECAIATGESCNERDDNCDGQVDEDFRDSQGRYVDSLHCGACGIPCAPPGENYRADCIAEGDDVRCDVACEESFVDVDGIAGNGCECQRFDGDNAPRVVGGDSDCDGQPDDNDLFVHVTNGGSDSGLGTLISPLRSINAGIARGKAQGKLVLVAQGSYAPFAMVAGVKVFGGYRTDFGDRNPELYPVVIEANASSDGAPVLTCKDIEDEAVLDGVTLVGQDAFTAGRGSTVAVFDRCGPAVKLSHVTLLAGRGADGARGQDASARLPAGFSSLSDLDGVDGRPGQDGDTNGQQCVAQPGGLGGTKQCAGSDVSGGRGGASSCGGTGCVNGRDCPNAGCTDFTVGGVCDYDAVLDEAVPNPSAQAGRGTRPGVAGALTYNAPTNRSECLFCDDNPTLQRLGQDGSDGRSGERGPGGAGCADEPLSFDNLGRANAQSGSAGVSGTNGSGGGGGTAGSGYDVIGGTTGSCDDNAGGSGAGGGSGGCGAPAGGGGGGGGASVGLLVRVTNAGTGPSFDNVRVVTASGGRGGDGGIGAAGGVGGAGALGGGSNFWCARNGGRGGEGGAGGAGGGGGGGCGGASHALVLRGNPNNTYRSTAEATLTVSLAGVAGQGGEGGFSPGFSGSQGESGQTAALR